MFGFVGSKRPNLAGLSQLSHVYSKLYFMLKRNLCYNVSMKTLSETNPYLQDKKEAERLIARSTRTSCGVEGIVAKNTPLKVKVDHSRSRAVYLKMKQKLEK